jgi:uncharacterized protein (DUF1810 family)
MMNTADPFDLERFVTAQASVIATALAELKAGRKRSHWMWFVFPQLRGLGHSSMATFYGIASLHEARAYLAHPVLGPRLELCTRTVLELETGSLNEIFGSTDEVPVLDDAVRRRGGRSGECFPPGARSLV